MGMGINAHVAAPLTPPPDEERRRMKTSHAILLALVALAFTAASSANAQASVADLPGVVGTAITGAATAPVKSFLCADGTSSGAIDWLNSNSPYRGDGFSSLLYSIFGAGIDTGYRLGVSQQPAQVQALLGC